MKKILFVLVLMASVVLFGNQAKSNRFAAGIVLGEPTGLSGVLNFNKQNGIDMVVSYSFGDRGSLNIHSDYIYRFYGIVPIPEGDTALYTGIGGRLLIRDDSHDDDISLGVRVPGGILYQLNKIPLEFLLEAAIILDIIPSTDADFNIFIGARYRF